MAGTLTCDWLGLGRSNSRRFTIDSLAFLCSSTRFDCGTVSVLDVAETSGTTGAVGAGWVFATDGIAGGLFGTVKVRLSVPCDSPVGLPIASRCTTGARWPGGFKVVTPSGLVALRSCRKFALPSWPGLC